MIKIEQPQTLKVERSLWLLLMIGPTFIWHPYQSHAPILTFQSSQSAIPNIMASAFVVKPEFQQQRLTKNGKEYLGHEQKLSLLSQGILVHAVKSNENHNDENNNQEKQPSNKKRNLNFRNGRKHNNMSYNLNMKKSKQLSKEKKKELVAQAAKELRRNYAIKRQTKEDTLLDIVNPFKAGKKLRNALESLTGISDSTKSIYLDDRIGIDGMSLAERNPDIQRQSDYIPEVLVVGATGEVGRLVVRQLLLNGKVRVRVLVRDLYSKTLNLLGTGVTYCQGDLANYESLEYALTDVDKIIFCAGAPRQDEADFNTKFQQYMQEVLCTQGNLTSVQTDKQRSSPSSSSISTTMTSPETVDFDSRQMSLILERRAKLAEQVDCIGMQNLIRAYHNVRYADYGASQTAKRSLFKFGSRSQDFELFAIEEVEEEEENKEGIRVGEHDNRENHAMISFDEEAPDDDDDHDEDTFYSDLSSRYYLSDGEDDNSVVQISKGRARTKTQCLWMRNAFQHAVFVGKVFKSGETSIVSSRLRSKEDPEKGIDLSNGFGGFVLRVCSDGGTYEAFIRSELFETDGIEYVCKFTTASKIQLNGEKSRNKFTTVRLAFENFKPVRRRYARSRSSHVSEVTNVPHFRGSDLRHVGFRFVAKDAAAPLINASAFSQIGKDSGYRQFYLAFDYIKVYRSQPEPEFVYLSDARIPPVITEGMVRHDRKQIREKRDSILDESDVVIPAADQRISEETYYKYLGEEILKGSGLAYTIVRVAGFNEISFGETSMIKLSTEPSLEAVSRSDVAQVCVSAILDPNARNKSFYMAQSLTGATSDDENIAAKFSQIPLDS